MLKTQICKNIHTIMHPVLFFFCNYYTKVIITGYYNGNYYYYYCIEKFIDSALNHTYKTKNIHKSPLENTINYLFGYNAKN